MYPVFTSFVVICLVLNLAGKIVSMRITLKTIFTFPLKIDTLIFRLQKQGMNASQAYEYFVLRAQKIALSHGYECINWYRILFMRILYSVCVSRVTL